MIRAYGLAANPDGQTLYLEEAMDWIAKIGAPMAIAMATERAINDGASVSILTPEAGRYYARIVIYDAYNRQAEMLIGAGFAKRDSHYDYEWSQLRRSNK